MQWFERMVAEQGHELWVGDPAETRARAVRRQKTDTRDAEHLLDRLLTERFPRIWVPTPEERDLRQLLKHRDKLVRMQTSVKNQLRYLRRVCTGCCARRARPLRRGGNRAGGCGRRGRVSGSLKLNHHPLPHALACVSNPRTPPARTRWHWGDSLRVPHV
ncbi:MAG TPA: transposase [Terriglobia bacterium]|nr:transposase [Terriglobia bacterium]